MTMNQVTKYHTFLVDFINVYFPVFCITVIRTSDKFPSEQVMEAPRAFISDKMVCLRNACLNSQEFLTSLSFLPPSPFIFPYSPGTIIVVL